MHEGRRFRLELVSLASDAPAIVRLRAALKLFLRVFQLRCVSVVEAPAAEQPAVDPAASAGGGV